MKNKKIHNNWPLVIGNWSLKRGFSLIELLFAMSFLTVIILGVVSLQTSNLAMMGGNNNRIQAHFLANQGAQIVKGIGYSAESVKNCKKTCNKIIKQTKGGESYEFATAAQDEYESVTANNMTFKRKVEVTPLDNAYKATVIVEWMDATGEHKTDVKLIVSN